jgi:hypothetical protein
MPATRGRATCKGLPLTTGAGITESATIGSTVFVTVAMPEWAAGNGDRTRSAGMVSRLEIRLKALSMMNGQTSRMATKAQSRQTIHFGAFFKRARASATARMSQLAVILIFKIFRNTALMLSPPS